MALNNSENIFGKRVSFKLHLTRLKKGKRREWVKTSSDWLNNNNKPVDGIIIGVRTLWNGYNQYELCDSGYVPVFIFEKSLKVYLVATDLKSNPVYVLPESII